MPLYHIGVNGLLLAALIGSFFNLYKAIEYDHNGLRVAIIVTVLSLAAILTNLFARVFPLKAQDRAIRSEENLRHYVLTGKLLDKRLTVRQIVGLRFASDSEFPELAAKAAAENMSADAIKKSVRNWRVDTDRL